MHSWIGVGVFKDWPVEYEPIGTVNRYLAEKALTNRNAEYIENDSNMAGE